MSCAFIVPRSRWSDTCGMTRMPPSPSTRPPNSGTLPADGRDMPILSLHHVTATVDDAQDDLDFCLDALGLRLVKKTVNFDNHHVYHFYYGDEHGTPGTLWTTFPYKGRGVPVGRKGAGQVTVTSFSVPAASLAFWKARLAERGISVDDAGTR